MPRIQLPAAPGIFEIHHQRSRRIYVGATTNIKEERANQRLLFVRFSHPCEELQKFFDKSPRKMVDIFEECDPTFRFLYRECESYDRAKRMRDQLTNAYALKGRLISHIPESELANV